MKLADNEHLNFLGLNNHNKALDDSHVLGSNYDYERYSVDKTQDNDNNQNNISAIDLKTQGEEASRISNLG